MNSNESDLLFTGLKSNEKYHTTWSSVGTQNTVTVTDRVSGRSAAATSNKALFKIQLKLIEALEK